jgi:hypothetical protein
MLTRSLSKSFTFGRRSATSDIPTTISLLHFNGASRLDGLATVVDETGRSWTRSNGTLNILSANQKFGNVGYFVDGINVGLSTTWNTDFDFIKNGKKFTMDVWVYRYNNTYARTLFSSFNGTGGISSYIATNGSLYFQYQAVGGFRQFNSTSQIPVTTWTHVAFCYDQDKLRGYVNGVKEIEFIPETLKAFSPTQFFFGRSWNSGSPARNMAFDELRIIKNQADFTDDTFTVPTSEYSLI